MAAIHSGTNPKVVNRLLLGDNLHYLQQLAPDSVHLITIDPPFNSNVRYGDFGDSPAQAKNFSDIWKYDSAAIAAYEFVMDGHVPGNYAGAQHMLEAMKKYAPSMYGSLHGSYAYIVQQTARLICMRRVLAPNGVIAWQCDDNELANIRLAMNAVFGAQGFLGLVTRQRSAAHNDVKQGSAHFGRVVDFLSVFTKGRAKDKEYTYNPQYKLWTKEETFAKFSSGRGNTRAWRDDGTGRGPYDFGVSTAPGGPERGNPILDIKIDGRTYRVGNKTRGSAFSLAKWNAMIADNRVDISSKGNPRPKRYLYEIPPERRGNAIQSLWTGAEMYIVPAVEKVNYPTQKPVTFVRRQVRTWSNPGDVVLDPCAGCGTSLVAAELEGRRFIGIDISHGAINTIEQRLERECTGSTEADLFETKRQLWPYVIDGDPLDMPSFIMVWEKDRYDAQCWAARIFGFKPGPRGRDRHTMGDGTRYITKDGNDRDLMLLSFKGGETAGARDVYELCDCMQEHGAAMGLLVTRNTSTSPMKERAARMNTFEGVPRVQIITVQEWFNGKRLLLPKHKA